MTAPLAMPRQPYWSLNSLIAAPILVPPDQSGAASPAFASMVSGVAFTSVAVSRAVADTVGTTRGRLLVIPQAVVPLGLMLTALLIAVRLIVQGARHHDVIAPEDYGQ